MLINFKLRIEILSKNYVDNNFTSLFLDISHKTIYFIIKSFYLFS